jgi:flagellin-like protein
MEREVQLLQNKFKSSGRRLRRSVKGISPVIATLLMIVIAVAASLVAYAWVMGYLGFTTAKTGKAIQIQSIARDPTTHMVKVYVQNVGDSDVTLSNVYVDGKLDDTATSEVGWGNVLGQTLTDTISLTDPVDASQVTVKVVAMDGTFMELTHTFTD